MQVYSLMNYFYFFFPSFFNSLIIKDSYLYINLKPKFIYLFLNFLNLHTNLQFKQILDIWGVDYYLTNHHYNVNYLLNSIYLNNRIFLRLFVKDFESIESATSVYNSAGWLEREVWDMFGIFFSNHKDLRRILTDYGFDSFPLRKEFPLTGFFELYYNFEEKRIVFNYLELSQEFRFFDYNNSWTLKK